MPRREIFKTVVRRGLERGEIRPDVDIEQLADVFMGNAIARMIVGLPFDERWRKIALETLWRGVRADPEPRRARRRGAGTD